MTLDLWQVEIGTRAAAENALGVVEEVEAEIHEGARNLGSIRRDMILKQMPAAGADDQNCRLRPDVVAPARLFLGEADLAKPVVHEIELAFDDILPGWREGVLEVGHEHARAGIQRVDDHLARRWPGNL